MKTSRQLYLSQEEYQTINSMLGSAAPEIAEFLEDELNRAAVVAKDQLPKDVVSINCKVEFIDLETQKKSRVTLVYPDQVDIDSRKISVLSPVGAALIGLNVGESIDWPLKKDHFKRLKIVSVEKQ